MSPFPLILTSASHIQHLKLLLVLNFSHRLSGIPPLSPHSLTDSSLFSSSCQQRLTQVAYGRVAPFSPRRVPFHRVADGPHHFLSPLNCWSVAGEMVVLGLWHDKVLRCGWHLTLDLLFYFFFFVFLLLFKFRICSSFHCFHLWTQYPHLRYIYEIWFKLVINPWDVWDFVLSLRSLCLDIDCVICILPSLASLY